MTEGGPPVGGAVHRFKRTVLAPQRARRRRRHRRDDPGRVALLEHFDYRTAVYRFLDHAAREPDLLHQLPDDTDLVFDVGGFVGEWCVPVAGRTDAPIHVYEPSVWARDRLLAAVADHPTIAVHTHGFGAGDRRVELARIGPGSTVYDGSDQWEKATVELRDAAVVLGGFEYRSATLKLNIEGGEYEVLERLLGTDRLDGVARLYVQFHEWLPDAHRRRRSIRRRLGRTHVPTWSYPWVWERWDRISRT